MYELFKTDNSLAITLRKNKQTHSMTRIGKLSCMKFMLKMVLNEGVGGFQIEIWWDHMEISRKVRGEI